MNKLIYEIAVKAKIQMVSEPRLQEFAELLLEEMYDFIMDESANDNGIPDLGKVKQHFGVEE